MRGSFDSCEQWLERDHQASWDGVWGRCEGGWCLDTSQSVTSFFCLYTFLSFISWLKFIHEFCFFECPHNVICIKFTFDIFWWSVRVSHDKLKILKNAEVIIELPKFDYFLTLQYVKNYFSLWIYVCFFVEPIHRILLRCHRASKLGYICIHRHSQ